jgi:hypothetical protein
MRMREWASVGGMSYSAHLRTLAEGRNMTRSGHCDVNIDGVGLPDLKDHYKVSSAEHVGGVMGVRAQRCVPKP